MFPFHVFSEAQEFFDRMAQSQYCVLAEIGPRSPYRQWWDYFWKGCRVWGVFDLPLLTAQDRIIASNIPSGKSSMDPNAELQPKP